MTDTPEDGWPRRTEYMPLDDLVKRMDPRNPKGHDDAGIEASLRRFGYTTPIEVDERTGLLVAGHGRIDNLRTAWVRGDAVPEGVVLRERDGQWLVPVQRGWESTNDDEALAYMVATNWLVPAGGWTDDLAPLLAELAQTDGGLPPGVSTDDLERLLAELDPQPAPPVPVNPPIADRFIIPPFTVLDGRSGRWQDRKRRWLSLGLQGEVGRDGGLAVDSPVGYVPGYYDAKAAAEAQVGHALTNTEFERDHLAARDTGNINVAGTSVFDPVLCEIAYRWHCPPGGLVLDPFAGGSTRGLVAAALGRRYYGIELRPEQVAANDVQAEALMPLLPEGSPWPQWTVGDALARLADAPQADLLFTCPPYADLEVYSDLDGELSALPWPEFVVAYHQAIAQAVDRLAPDSFAVWVVGEVRDKATGHYRGLVPTTVQAFLGAGCAYHNEAVLVTPVGALPVIVGRQFPPARRMVKTHQTVLVFCKGNPRRAAERCGPVDVATAADLLDADQ